MKFARLLLPGEFEDAFLYRGRLLALTAERTLRTYNLDQIVTSIEERLPASRPWPNLLFAHNDWLTSEQFVAVTSNLAVSEVLVNQLNNFPEQFVLTSDELKFSEHELSIAADVLLDMQVYNNRLYIGANTGLYHVNIGWYEPFLELDGTPQKRLDARCLSTTVRFGAVNASCGDDGLFTLFNEFAWAYDSVGESTQRMSQTASHSYKTAWLDYDLVNYATYTDLQLLQAHRERVRSSTNDDQERTLLVDINGDGSALELVWQALYEKYSVPKHDIAYACNSSGVVFVSTHHGQLYSIGLEGMRSGHLGVSFTKLYEGLRDMTLSATPTKLGLLVETESQISVFSANQWQSILHEEALTVRTFQMSRRYQNVVAITTESGIWLIGMFNESGKSARRGGLR